MRLTSLFLENFRNHQKLELEFDPAQPVTYIVGENAQGKTNILEAIYLLALTKSFRTNRSQDMIGWSQEYGRVKGIFEMSEPVGGEIGTPGPKVGTQQQNSDHPSRPCELEIFLGCPPHPQKVLKKNGVKISSTNFIGNCQIVFFHPEDLNILYLGPDLRRRYLDILNIQIDKKYFQALRSYRRILEQRNALLKAMREGRAGRVEHTTASHSDLQIWDEKLAEHGAYLILRRAETVEFLEKYLEEYYQKISQKGEKVKVHYLSGTGEEFKNEDGFLKPKNETKSVRAQTLAIQNLFQESLAKNRAKDLQAGITTIGPHRDDIEFSLNGLPLASHASRGEYRSLLLALKLLEIKFYEELTGNRPILLLDDVFSELDYHRQAMLMEGIQEHQTIITTTHLDLLEREDGNILFNNIGLHAIYED